MKHLLLFAALVAWSGVAGAVVYKWVDAQGKVQYGDRPPDGVHVEVVEMLGTHAARSTGARSSESAPPVSRTTTRDQPNQSDSTAKKAVDEDVAQTREKQCAEAQDRYKKLIEGRRLYKTGENGEREYLTSEEIDTQRMDAKRDVDATCNGTT
jgi:hypothetical protein